MKKLILPTLLFLFLFLLGSYALNQSNGKGSNQSEIAIPNSSELFLSCLENEYQFDSQVERGKMVFFTIPAGTCSKNIDWVNDVEKTNSDIDFKNIILTDNPYLIKDSGLNQRLQIWEVGNSNRFFNEYGISPDELSMFIFSDGQIVKNMPLNCSTVNDFEISLEQLL